MIAPEQDGGAMIISSERLSDDPGWETVPPGHLLAVSAAHEADLTPL
jgi:predicted glutamine amidotransferase